MLVEYFFDLLRMLGPLGAAEVAALTGQASPAGQASQLGRTPPPAPTPAMEDR